MRRWKSFDKNVVEPGDAVEVRRSGGELFMVTEARQTSAKTGRLEIWGAIFSGVYTAPFLRLSRQHAATSLGQTKRDAWLRHFGLECNAGACQENREDSAAGAGYRRGQLPARASIRHQDIPGRWAVVCAGSRTMRRARRGSD
jgi:hypothetical protein